MDSKLALSKLEKLQKAKYNIETFDEIKELFQYFLKAHEPNNLAKLLVSLIYYNKYDWIIALLNDKIISYIEERGEPLSKVFLYNSIIYSAFVTDNQERTIFYAYKLLRMDTFELPYFTVSYQYAIVTLLLYDMFDESLEFIENTLKRIEIFGMPNEHKFCAYINAYQVYSNLTEPNKQKSEELKSMLLELLQDEEFSSKYKHLLEIIFLESEWKEAKKDKSLINKKNVAKNIVKRIIPLIRTKNINVHGSDLIFEVLRFYLENGEYGPFLEYENDLFNYYTQTSERINLLGIYAEYYETIDNKDKSFLFYKEYCRMIRENEANSIEKKKNRFKEIFREAQITKENEILHQIIMYDEATGCYSREYLKSSFKQLFTGTLFLIDLDNLKSINDKYGHLFGDKYIEYFSKILREIAERHGANIYRFGGDEFVITIPSIDKKTAIEFIESVYDEFKMSYLIDNIDTTFRFCTGIAISENKTLNMAFNDADTAMYKMKSLSKNQYSF